MITAITTPTITATKTGTVYLIGAGPGDPGLMTVKGMTVLRQAEAVLYDALINPALLQEAPTNAELIDVGKRAGKHRMSQDDINRLLLETAYSCKTVVRLKGGDPFVFGRGGEEMLYLRTAGIPVEVVPGVTSATAALAYAGVPVTHRQVAGNFAVITGHRTKDGQSQDWASLAKLDTLVILMGLRNARHIAGELVAVGRSPETPAMAIHWGTMPTQQVVSATLATLADEIAEARLKSPAILVIGDVVGLSPALSWFPTA